MGHKPGVYSEWTEAQVQIQGVKGPKYKKFGTRREAEEFVRSGGGKNASLGGKGKRGRGGDEEEKDEDEKDEDNSDGGVDGERASKKARTAKGGWGKEEVVKVWTDGSSRGNGKVGALAGVGVWFGEGDSRFVFLFSFLSSLSHSLISLSL